MASFPASKSLYASIPSSRSYKTNSSPLKNSAWKKILSPFEMVKNFRRHLWMFRGVSPPSSTRFFHHHCLLVVQGSKNNESTGEGVHSLKLTASLPLKIGWAPKENEYSNHPFSGAKMLVSGRVNPEFLLGECFGFRSRMATEMFPRICMKWLQNSLNLFRGYFEIRDLFINLLYCWWKKSCTSWYGEPTIICRVLHIPDGAGFFPSTVCPRFA